MTEQTASAPRNDLNEDEALRLILEGTVGQTGQAFFRALVSSVAQALGCQGAWVTEYLPQKNRLRALAFRLGDQWLDGYEYALAGTPCEPVVQRRCLVHFPDNIVPLYPRDHDLQRMKAVSYMGVPLLDDQQRVLGNLAVLDTRPMPAQPRAVALFRIFAAQAAAELRRVRAEQELRQREQKLTRLLGGAMDAIVELDEKLRVVLFNPAAEKILDCPAEQLQDADFTRFLSAAGHQKLLWLIRQLQEHSSDRSSLWIAGGLEAVNARGQAFTAEATLSRNVLDSRVFHTLILRNVEDRREAERRIGRLEAETEYLRTELRNRENFGRIIGRSPAILEVLRAIEQVAATDATVLIQGETGTGKELVARAIHDSSARRDKPLVCVNCAAVPEALMESEFFGHEKGAFTGATQKRRGRFALADGGTIFLDEVGELPLDLQAKLLRVLQHGEFEPVGSSQTHEVNVRVVAATNRDLKTAVTAGRFREDLYFRLHVFPIELPPLRQRPEDIPLLAEAFLERLGRKMGRQPLEPLAESDLGRLQAYAWPGNVRELENVIERALIISPGHRLDLERALPDPDQRPSSPPTSAPAGPPGIRTAAELVELEKHNIQGALEACGWRVSGPRGAAHMLGLPPSTLNSRIKALGIRRR